MIFPQRSPEVINLELMPQPPQTRSPNNPWPHWPLVFKAGAWPCGDGCGVSMISVMSWAACLWIFLDTFRCLPHTNISRQFQTYMLAEYFFVMYRGTSNNKSGCYDQERCKKGIKPAWKGICSRLKGGKQLFGAIKSGDCNIGMVNYPKWPTFVVAWAASLTKWSNILLLLNPQFWLATHPFLLVKSVKLLVPLFIHELYQFWLWSRWTRATRRRPHWTRTKISAARHGRSFWIGFSDHLQRLQCWFDQSDIVLESFGCLFWNIFGCVWFI